MARGSINVGGGIKLQGIEKKFKVAEGQTLKRGQYVDIEEVISNTTQTLINNGSTYKQKAIPLTDNKFILIWSNASTFYLYGRLYTIDKTGAVQALCNTVLISSRRATVFDATYCNSKVIVAADVPSPSNRSVNTFLIDVSNDTISVQHELNLNISYCQTISIETTDSNKVFLVCTSSNAGLCKLLNVANDTITVLASNSLGGSFGYGVMQTKIGNNTHFIVGVYRLNTSSPGYLYGAFATISGNDFTLTSISNSIAVNSSGFHITEDYSAVTLDTNKVAITVRTTSSQQTVWVYRLDPGNNSAQAISLTIPTLLLDSCLSRHNGNTFVLSCFNGANTGGIDCYVIEENTSMLNIKHSRRITAYDTSNISQCNIINLTLLTYVNSSDSDFTYSCTIDAAPKVTKALTQANIKGVAMSVGSAGDTIEINTL